MRTLFISTYTNLITIGLLKNNKLIDKKEKPSVRTHAEHLLPLIDNILNENNLKPEDINEIKVINGPGSFTGVRLGVTVAKTLAYTLNIPIKVINTIEALAISNKKEQKKIVKVDDPKGSYYGIFENNIQLGILDYLKESEFREILNKNKDILIVDDQTLDIEAICAYLSNQPSINPHLVKPIYIKQIEVQNG